MNLAVTDTTLSAAHAETAVALGNSGTTTIAGVSDSYDNLSNGAFTAIASHVGNLAVTDTTLTVAHAALVESYANTGTTTFAGLQDTAAALAGASAVIADHTTTIAVTGSATVAQAEIINAFTATINTYALSDTADVLAGATDNAYTNASTVTLTTGADVAQITAINAHEVTVEGYSLADTASNLISASSALVFGATQVAVTDVATTGQVSTISSEVADSNTTTYAGILGTASDILSLLVGLTPAVIGYNIGSLNVTGLTNASDVITIESAVSNTGSDTFAAVSGSYSEIMSIGEYASDIVDLTVTGSLTTAHAENIATLNNIGLTTISNVSGSYAQVTDSAFTDIIANVVNLAVTDNDLTVTQAQNALTLGNTGNTTVAGVAGIYSAVLNLASIASHIGDIEVTDEISVVEAATVAGFAITGVAMYDQLTDSAAALAGASEVIVGHAVVVTVNTAATVAQAEIINAFTVQDQINDYNLADSAQALATAPNSAYANAAAVSLTTAATVEQLNQITAHAGVTLATYDLADTAAAIVGAGAVMVGEAASVAVTDIATTTQVLTIVNTEHASALTTTYAGILGTAGNILDLVDGTVAAANVGSFSVEGLSSSTDVTNIEDLANTGSNSFAEVAVSYAQLADVSSHASDIVGLTVTGSINVSQVSTVSAFANTGAKSIATVSDSVAHAITLDFANYTVGSLVTTGTASVANATTIDGFKSAGEVSSVTYSISDVASVVAGAGSNVLADATNITATGNVIASTAQTILNVVHQGHTSIEQVTGSATDLAGLAISTTESISTLVVDDGDSGHLADLASANTIAGFEIAGQVGSATYDLYGSASSYDAATAQALNFAHNISVIGDASASEAQLVGSATNSGTLTIESIADYYTSIQGLLSTAGGQHAVTTASGVYAYGDDNTSFMDLGGFTNDVAINNTVNLHIYTGSGNDTVYSGAGNDFIGQWIGESWGVGNAVIKGAAGYDTIDSGMGSDTITAGTQADLVSLYESWSYQNVLYQGTTDSIITTDISSLSGGNIAVGTALTFGSGVDIINHFKAGFVDGVTPIFTGDTLKVDFTFARSMVGENANSMGYSGYLGGSWDATTGVFTVAAADAATTDTIIVQISGNDFNNLVLGYNESIVLLEGVNQLDLVNENFGGHSLTAAWSGTAHTYTVYGDTLSGFAMNDTGHMNVTTRYLPAPNSFNESLVTSMDFTGVNVYTGSQGVTINVDGGISSLLNSVIGSAADDTIVEASEVMGAEGSMVDGRGGYNTLEFQSLSSLTLGLAGETFNNGIVNINEIKLDNGTSGGGLTLEDSLSNLLVTNQSSVDGATVDLGAGSGNTFDYLVHGSSVANQVTLGAYDQSVDAWSGNNTVILSAEINYGGDLHLGTGTNTIFANDYANIYQASVEVSGSGTWTLELAADATVYISSAQTHAAFDILGSGNETINVVTWEGSYGGPLTDYILNSNIENWNIGANGAGSDQGAGTNSVTIGSASQYVTAGSGNDTLNVLNNDIIGSINLRGGNNTLVVTGNYQDISVATITDTNGGYTQLEISGSGGMNYYADTGRVQTDLASFAQGFDDAVGTVYTVTAWVWGGGGISGVAFQLDADVKVIAQEPSSSWNEVTFTFTGTGHDTLYVGGFNNPDSVAFDNVVVTSDGGLTNLITNGDFQTGDASGWTVPGLSDVAGIFSDATNPDVAYTADSNGNWDVQGEDSGSHLTMTTDQYNLFELAGQINAHGNYSTTTITFTDASDATSTLDSNVGNWVLGGTTSDINIFKLGDNSQTVTGSGADDTIYLTAPGVFSGSIDLAGGSNTITAGMDPVTPYDLTNEYLANITTLNTASTGTFSYLLNAGDVAGITHIVFNDDESATNTLFLTSDSYDFTVDGKSITFGASLNAVINLDGYGNDGNTTLTLHGSDVNNVTAIVGQTLVADTTTLSFVNSADISGATVTNVQTVNETGNSATLALNIAGFTTSNYKAINATGTSDTLKLVGDGATIATLTSTTIAGFTNIDTLIGNHNIVLDDATIANTEVVTWTALDTDPAQTGFWFNQDYNASNWTLTNGDYHWIGFGTNVDLIVSDTFLSDTITFSVGSDDTLVINNVGDDTNGHRDFIATTDTYNDGSITINAADVGAYVDLNAASADAWNLGTWTLVGGNGDDTFKGSKAGYTTFEFGAAQLTSGDTITGRYSASYGGDFQNTIQLTTHAFEGTGADIVDADFTNVTHVQTLATINDNVTSATYHADYIELGTLAEAAGITVLDASNTFDGVIELGGGYNSNDLTVELSQNTQAFYADGDYYDAFTSNLIVNYNSGGLTWSNNDTYIGTGLGYDTVNADLGGENIYTNDGNDMITLEYGANFNGTTIDGGSGTDTLLWNTDYRNGWDGLSDNAFTHMVNLERLVIDNNLGSWDNGIELDLGVHTNAAFAGGLSVGTNSSYLAIYGSGLTINLTAGGTDNNHGLYNTLYSETIQSGSGNDTIYGAGEDSYITAGHSVDTVILDPWAFDYSSYYTNDVYQGTTDGVLATDVTNLSGSNIADGTVITFGNGVDLIRNFRPGINSAPTPSNWNAGNIDILHTDFAQIQFLLGQDAYSLNDSGILAGNYVYDGDTSTWVFEVTANNSGSDTLVIQSSTNNDLTFNTSMVVLQGVHAADLTSWNFGGVGLVADFNISNGSYSVWGGAAQVVTINANQDGENVQSSDVYYIGSYVAGDVTSIDASQIFTDYATERTDGSSNGVIINIDGLYESNLNYVGGTTANDTFVYSNEVMGSSEGVYVDGWYGYNTIQFTTFESSTTIGDYYSGDTYRIDQIDEIDLIDGTTGTLTLDNSDGGLDGIWVDNQSSVNGATVDLGTSWNGEFSTDNPDTGLLNDTSNTVTMGSISQSIYVGSGNDTAILTDGYNYNNFNNMSYSYFNDIQLGGGSNTVVLNDGVNIAEANVSAVDGSWALDVYGYQTAVEVSSDQLQGLGHASSVYGDTMETAILVNTNFGGALGGVDVYTLASTVGYWDIGVDWNGNALGNGNNYVAISGSILGFNTQNVSFGSGNDELVVGSYATNGDFNLGAGTNVIIADDLADISHSLVTTSGAGTWELDFGHNAGVTISTAEVQSAHAFVADGVNTLTVHTGSGFGGALVGYTLASEVQTWNIGVTTDGTDLGAQDNSVTIGSASQYVTAGSGNDTLNVLNNDIIGSINLRGGNNTLVVTGNYQDISVATITDTNGGYTQLEISGSGGMNYYADTGRVQTDLASFAQGFDDAVGTVYTVTAWVWGGGGISGVAFQLDADVKVIAQEPSSSWNEVTFTFTGTGHDTLYVGGFNNPDSVAFDNVVVTSDGGLTNLITNGDFQTGDASGWTVPGLSDVAGIFSDATNPDVAYTADSNGNWDVQGEDSGSHLTMTTDQYNLFELAGQINAHGNYSTTTITFTDASDATSTLDSNVGNWVLGGTTSDINIFKLGDNSQTVTGSGADDTIYLTAPGVFSGSIDLAGGSNTITAGMDPVTPYDLTNEYLANITTLNTASTGTFSYLLNAGDVAGITHIVFNDDESATNTLFLTSDSYDFTVDGKSITFGASLNAVINLDGYGNDGNTTLTLHGSDVNNVTAIVGQTLVADTTTLSFVNSADISGATVTNVQTVNETGNSATLALNIAGFTTSNYKAINATGTSDTLKLVGDGATIATLTSTTIAGFTNIDTLIGNHNIVLDDATIANTEVVTWTALDTDPAQTGFWFNQDYNASNWTLTNGDYHWIGFGTNVDLIVSDTFLSDTITFSVGSDDTLVINNVGDDTNGHRDFIATTDTYNDGSITINAADVGAYVDLNAASADAWNLGTWTLVGGNGDDTFKGSKAGYTTFEFGAAQLTSGDTITGRYSASYGGDFQNTIQLTTHAFEGTGADIVDADFTNVTHVQTLATINDNVTSATYHADYIELGTLAEAAGITVLDASNTFDGVIELGGGYNSNDLTVELSQNTQAFYADGDYYDAFTSNLIVNYNSGGLTWSNNDTYIGTGLGYDTVNADLGGENIYTNDGNDMITLEYGANFNGTTIDGGSGTDTLLWNTDYRNGWDGLSDNAFTHMVNLERLVIDNNLGSWDNGIELDLGVHTNAAFAGGLSVGTNSSYLAIYGSGLTINLTAGGTDNNHGLYNTLYSETIQSGSGNDTIYGAGEDSYITAGHSVDTVILDPWAFDYSSYYTNDVYQGTTDGVLATDVTNLSGSNIADGTVITFGNGVDLIRNFRPGINSAPTPSNWNAGNIDILHTDFAQIQFLLGQDAYSLNDSGILAGNYVYDGDTSTWVFEVTANNSGSDTLVIQSSTNNDLTFNTSMVVLQGVHAADLTSWNFGGVGLVADFNISNGSYSVWGGAAQVVTINANQDGENVQSSDVYYIGSYVAGDVTSIDASQIFTDYATERTDGSSNGVIINIDGLYESNLNYVGGTTANDTFVYSNEVMGSSEGVYVDGWYGYNTIQFTTFESSTTIGDYYSGDTYRIDQIDEIDLIDGTTGTLTLDNSDGGLDGIWVDNQSSVNGATVDLGTSWNGEFSTDNPDTGLLNDTSNTVTMGSISQSIYVGSGNDTAILTDGYNYNNFNNMSYSYFNDIQLGGGSNTVVLNDGVNIAEANVSAVDGSWALDVYGYQTAVEVSSDQLQGLGHASSVYGDTMETAILVNTNFGGALGGVDVYTLASTVGYWDIGVDWNGNALGNGNNYVAISGSILGFNTQNVSFGSGNDELVVGSYATNGDFNLGAGHNYIDASNGADISSSGISTSGAGYWDLNFLDSNSGVTISTTQAGSVDSFLENGSDTVTVHTGSGFGGALDGYDLASNIATWNIGVDGSGADLGAGNNTVNLLLQSGDNSQDIYFGSGDDQLNVRGNTTSGTFDLGGGENVLYAGDGADISGSYVYSTDGTWTLNMDGGTTITVSSDQLTLMPDGGDPATDIIVSGTGARIQVDTNAMGPLTDYVLNLNVANWYIGVDTTLITSLGDGANSVALTVDSFGVNNQSVYSGTGDDTLYLNAAGAFAGPTYYDGTINMGGGINTIQTDYTVDISAATLVNVQAVEMGGSNQSLYVNENQFTESNLLSLTGDGGNANLVIYNGSAISLDLTNTTISGFDAIDVSALGSETVKVDALSVDAANSVTWYGDGANFEFTQTYNASNWTLSNSQFHNLTIDTGVHLTADQSLLANSTVTFLIAAPTDPFDATTGGQLTLNNISDYTAISGTQNFGTAAINLSAGVDSYVDVRNAHFYGPEYDFNHDPTNPPPYTHGWNITGNTGNDTVWGSASADTITDNLGGANLFAGMDGADTISTSGLTHLGADIFYQRNTDSNQATDTVLSSRVSIGNTLTFGDGVDIINGFNIGIDAISIDNYSTGETPILALGTRYGTQLSLGTGLYAIEGNFDSGTGLFTVTANHGGNATVIVEGVGDTLTNNQSMVVLVGVHDDNLTAANFIGH